MTLDLEVVHQAGTWPSDAETIARTAAERALVGGLNAATGRLVVGITLTDNTAVQRLNASYRQRDNPTNVLSFPVQQRVTAPLPVHPLLLGDVVLALETVAAEAADQGKSLTDHLAHLVVHGVLHLIGYGHDDAAEARRMEDLETRILATMGVGDPYADVPLPTGVSASKGDPDGR